MARDAGSKNWGKGFVGTILFALLVPFTGPAGVHSAPACSGGPVAHTDSAGDASSGGLDLVAFSARWTADSLDVTWQLASPPKAGPARVLLVGVAGPFGDGAAPYVFAEVRPAPGGATWSYGAGFYASAESRSASPWLDTWRAAARPSVTGTIVSISVPSNRLYRFRWGAPSSVSWMGIPAAMSDPSDDRFQFSQFIYGWATAPVAISATPGFAAMPGSWQVTDAAPEDRVVSDATGRYGFRYRPADPGYAPELCRPQVPLQSGPVVRCSYEWATDGPGWFAARLDVAAASTEAGLAISFGAFKAPGSAVMAGILSESGDADLFPIGTYGSPAWATADVGAARVEVGDPTGMLTAMQSHGSIWDRTSFVLPRVGSWWFVAVAAGEVQEMTASFEISSPGIGCGPQATGSTAEFVPFERFRRGAGASVSPFGAWGGAGLQALRTHPIRARHGVLAVLGGAQPFLLGESFSFDSRSPGGRQHAEGLVPPVCTCGEGFLGGLFEFGPPGSYTFGVNYDLLLEPTLPVSGWPGLLWADIALP